MFLELIATIFAGVAGAGVMLLLGKVMGGRLPRWLTPVTAGACMIAMTISSEYTWFERTRAQLPEGVEVAMTVDERSWYRPWTQLFPYTNRFVAVDTATTRTNAAVPDQRLADLYFFGRWSPVNQAPVLFDCGKAQSAVLIDGAEFEPNGSVSNADWQAVPADDPVFSLVCET